MRSNPAVGAVRPLTVALLLASNACSPADGPDSDAIRQVELDCEREAYPCTLGEVSAELLERSDQLANQAYARMAAGDPVPDVARWLRGQTEVVAAESSNVALWFRIDGGRPHWVLSSEAFAEIPDASPPAIELGARKHIPKEVVGISAKEKQALVIAPYLWQFGQWDSGPAVGILLQDARGYEGNVVQRANDDMLDQTVTVGDFQNWDAFDVVHVSSHGTQICGSGGCRSALAYGIVTSGAATSEIGPVIGGAFGTSASKHLILDSDFFRARYSGGLEKTLVFIDACKSIEAPDFADLFATPSSVYFGWDDTVGVGFSQTASTTLIGELIESGRTTEQVYEMMIDENVVREPDGTVLRRVQGGDDLRIREIITAHAPGTTPALETELQDGDAMPLDGVLGDGNADAMRFNVHVDGVGEDDDLSRYVLHISVNGTEATQTWTLEEAAFVDTYTYRLERVAEFGVDFEESDLFDVQFWVDLPEGGRSRHQVELKPAKWTMEFAGPFLAGIYSGSVARLALSNALGVGNILIFETGEIDQKPEVRINTTWFSPILSGENVFELRAPPSPAGPDDLEGNAISVIIFRDVVDDGMGLLVDSGVVNGDGVTPVIQPDDSIYTSPSPPTLTLFDYDPDATAVRGTIEGPYGVCYGFIDLGPQGFCDTYDVSISFFATRN